MTYNLDDINGINYVLSKLSQYGSFVTSGDTLRQQFEDVDFLFIYQSPTGTITVSDELTEDAVGEIEKFSDNSFLVREYAPITPIKQTLDLDSEDELPF